MADLEWQENQYGFTLVTDEGSAFIGPWLNPSFVYGIIFHRDGHVEEVSHFPDHHEPFEGVRYSRASARMKAVIESKLRVRPSQWARLGGDEDI